MKQMSFHWQAESICAFLEKTMMKIAQIKYVKLQEKKIKSFKRKSFKPF